MKATVACATLGLILAGCADSADRDGHAEAECTPQIRMDGVSYRGAGYTNREATKLGTADEAECQDDGLDPAGIVFPENPRQVAVWSFAEYSPDDVLAVRFNQEYSFAVFVNASVPQPRADAIVRELGQPE
jgi:hypothetical protein